MVDTSRPQGDEDSGRRFINLAIPEDLYEEVLHFLVDRRRQQAGSPSAAADPAAIEDRDARAPREALQPGPGMPSALSEREWDVESLRRFLQSDGTNERLVAAIITIARSEEARLSTEAITAAVGLKPGRSWGGFISRAQASARHRWGRELPIRPKWSGELWTNEYWMNPEDADVVVTWADSQGL